MGEDARERDLRFTMDRRRFLALTGGGAMAALLARTRESATKSLAFIVRLLESRRAAICHPVPKLHRSRYGE